MPAPMARPPLRVPDALVTASNSRGRAFGADGTGEGSANSADHGPAADEGVRSLRRVQAYVGRKFGAADEADGGAPLASGGLVAMLKAKLFPPTAQPITPPAGVVEDTPRVKALRAAEAASSALTGSLPVSPLTLFLAVVAAAVSVTAWFPSFAAVVPIGLALAAVAWVLPVVAIVWRRSPLLLALLAGTRPYVSAPDLALEAAEAAVEARAVATEAKAAEITKVRGQLERMREELLRATAASAAATASETGRVGAAAAAELAEAQRRTQAMMRELIAAGVLPDVAADMDARRRAAAVAASKEEWRARSGGRDAHEDAETERVLERARRALYPRRTSDLKRRAELSNNHWGTGPAAGGLAHPITPRTGVTAAHGLNKDPRLQSGSESSLGLPPRRRSSKARAPPPVVVTNGGASGGLRHSFPVTRSTTRVV
ncbi:hypothetical protein MMPV_007243 [Pyropia vietnamensis]